MAADSTIVIKRVTSILEASIERAFTSRTDPRKNWNATDISEAVTEAALLIGRHLVNDPTNVHRNVFISGTPVTLTHAGEMPDYMSEYDVVEIERYTSAGFRTGIRTNAFTVEEYRANPSSIYDAVAHSTTGSTLGGYYALEHNRIYYSGLNCRTYCPTISRSTVNTLIPDEFEGCWVAFGVGLSAKNESMSGQYMKYGLQCLSQPDSAIPEVALNGG